METRERILVVDDETAIWAPLAEVLQAVGYDVLFASSGKEALEAVQREKPDVLLLDLMMPDLNGYEVCRILKGDPETQDIPIVILTGFQDPEVRDMAMASGADEFLTKPFSKPELLRRTGSVLRTRRLAQRVRELEHQLAALQHPA